MLKLFFGDVVSIITTLLAHVLLAFLVTKIVNERSMENWGRLILLAVVVGTALSGLSATRDAFMTDSVLFALSSTQSLICSIAGGTIYLLGLSALVIRKQGWRKAVFHLVAALLAVQIITIEGTHITMLAGLGL